MCLLVPPVEVRVAPDSSFVSAPGPTADESCLDPLGSNPTTAGVATAVCRKGASGALSRLSPDRLGLSPGCRVREPVWTELLGGGGVARVQGPPSADVVGVQGPSDTPWDLRVLCSGLDRVEDVPTGILAHE